MKSIILMTVLVFLLACTESYRTGNHAENVKLIGGHMVGFAMDERTSYKSFFVKSFQEVSGQELLVFLSADKPSIQLFDMENGRMVNEIFLTNDGPDGVGQPTGLLVQSLDSIYVVSSMDYLVSLVNKHGNVVARYRLLEGKNYNENTGMIRPYTISPPVKVGQEIYFNVAPDRDVYRPSYFQGHTNLSLNVKTGESRYFNVYPDEFRKGVWGVASVGFSTTFNEKTSKFVYSFAISDSIDVFDPVTREKTRFLARSTFKKTEIEQMTKPDYEHDLEYALTTWYYGAIVYDRFQDVYYRFVKHPIPLKDANGDINGYHEKPVSILVIDNDFSILGETLLRKDVFLDHIYFVSEDGLFVSNGNPENPELQEDTAVFTCFKIKKSAN